nr:helix-turn-helix domain-containing protein [Candidatus Sigynarchaeum springense]
MSEDGRINMAVPPEQKALWVKEAKARGRTLTGFIADCIERVLNGSVDTRPGDELSAITEKFEKQLAEQRELMNTWRQLYENMASIKAIKGATASIARADPPGDMEVDMVRAALAKRGSATIKMLEEDTGVSKASVYKSLQILVDAGEITEDATKAPTKYKVNEP